MTLADLVAAVGLGVVVPALWIRHLLTWSKKDTQYWHLRQRVEQDQRTREYEELARMLGRRD